MMEFKKLAEYWESLEKVSGRLEMTRILAELFKEADIEEIERVVYLSLGQLGPSYEQVEFNVAEKMMLRVLVQAYGVELDVVKKSYKELGDLGLVACELAKSENRKAQNYNVKVKTDQMRVQDSYPKGGQALIRILNKLKTKNYKLTANA